MTIRFVHPASAVLFRPWLNTVVEAAEASGSPAPDVEPAEFEQSVEPVTPQASAAYTEDDLARVRQEEKAKLYADLQRAKEERDALRREREEEVARQEEQRRAAEAEAKRKAEEEMDVRELLRTKEQEWQQQIEQERLERERAIAMLDKERRRAELESYRNRRVEESREDILPELVDLIGGDSEEQIEASIAGLVERSSRILGSVQQASQAVRRDTSGARVTAPSAGPMETYSDSRQYTPDQIRDMSIEEYTAVRADLLGRGQGSGQGLFG